MALISVCECEDCSRSNKPCKEYSNGKKTTTTCMDERCSSEWCQGCQDDFQQEHEQLKLEEASEEAERRFEEGFGV